jgi:hypothetical protein
VGGTQQIYVFFVCFVSKENGVDLVIAIGELVAVKVRQRPGLAIPIKNNSATHPVSHSLRAARLAKSFIIPPGGVPHDLAGGRSGRSVLPIYAAPGQVRAIPLA